MKNVGVSDADLVASFSRGDEKALKLLLDKYSASVFNLIFQRVKDEDHANDILQEVWIKFIRVAKAGEYKELGEFSGWIHMVARNAVMDFFRKRKRSKLIGLEECGDSVLGIKDEAMNFEESIQQEQWNLDVRMAVGKLPQDQQEVIKLRMTSGLSFKEIAIETGVGINTALGRMRYALMNLRRILEIESQ